MPGSQQHRSCGVLLHPTSLPGPCGVGDIGSAAHEFVRFLRNARQGIWQVLPLGPIGKANSPYDSSSAFAGSSLLIAERWLVKHRLLDEDEIEPDLESTDRADFEAASARKDHVLRCAFKRFREHRQSELTTRLEGFRRRETGWLDDFALFNAITADQDGASWWEWPDELARRDPDALERCRAELDDELLYHQFVQFVFDLQWKELRDVANQSGVRMMGDIPIYVSLDSSDVWANQRIFELDEDYRPTVVAGVPPDYFSETGQLWGNPCYRWEELRRTGYRWWVERFRRMLALTDMVRVDHFRAFQHGWQVPSDESTAINGRWVSGPGADIFEAVRSTLGPLPIVVEDLGLITDDVHDLRRGLGYPGMKVLQFAFGGDSHNPYLPHNIERNAVVYTGTHDNNTTAGWYAGLEEPTRDHLERYLGGRCEEINWSLIRLAHASVASTAIVPAQDLLGLGSDARMNTPGTVEENWHWRLMPDALSDQIAHRLKDMAEVYGRFSE
ncbi:MAG: 4-alpha-glucanotransferase [Nitrolancea sp.]